MNRKTPLLASVRTEYDNLTELSILGQAISSLMITESAEDIVRMLEADDMKEIVESDSFELTTEAHSFMRDGRLCIEYEETALTGMEGTKTEISFNPQSPDLIFISRAGSVLSTLVIEQNKRHLCTYQTPYMPFEMVVYAAKAQNSLTLQGGSLELDYFIEIKGAAMQRIRLSLTAKPLGGTEDTDDRS